VGRGDRGEEERGPQGNYALRGLETLAGKKGSPISVSDRDRKGGGGWTKNEEEGAFGKRKATTGLHSEKDEGGGCCRQSAREGKITRKETSEQKKLSGERE